MAISAPTNADLPSSILLPGVYFKLNLSGSGAGLNSPSTRLVLIANKTTAGTAQADVPIQVTSQSDANTFFGAGSDMARMFAATLSQVGPGACDTYCLPIVEPSAGTAAIHQIIIAGPATSSGSITATICGYSAATAIANGDTATIIAANLSTAINTLTNLPVTSAASTGTISLTYRHKGLVGNDLPRSVNIAGATGVTASPAQLQVSFTATGAGTMTVSVGGSTVSYAVGGTDSLATTTTGLTAAINAVGSFPVTASSPSAGTINLLHVPDRVVHRIVVSNGAVLTQILNVATGPVTGAGLPVLTNALVNMASQTAFPVWVTSFNDNNGTSSFNGGNASNSLTTIQSHLNTYGDGYNQKGQVLFFGATESLAVSGGYQSSTGMNSSTSGRYGSQIWQVDAAQQAHELACRCAATRITQQYMPKNYAGSQLVTKGTVPLLAPHKAVRSSQADWNAAMLTYYMTPVALNESAGALYIVRDRTTSSDQDQRTWSWGGIAVIDYIRADLNVFLSTMFAGKSFRPSGVTPRTPNTVTANSVREAIVERFRQYDSIDFIDDFDSIAKGIVANPDAIVANRVDVFVPIRIPVPLYQIAGVAALV